MLYTDREDVTKPVDDASSLAEAGEADIQMSGDDYKPPSQWDVEVLFIHLLPAQITSAQIIGLRTEAIALVMASSLRWIGNRLETTLYFVS